MNVSHALTLGLVLSFGLPHAALAIELRGQPALQATVTPATGRVERGGQVSTVDAARRTMVVGGVLYVFRAAPVTIHGPVAGKDTTLQAGLQVRFSTSKHNFSGEEQVQEVWVVAPPARSAKK